MATRMYNQSGMTSGLMEAVGRKLVYSGSNQGPGGTTTTVGLAATYTGLALSNPTTSGKNLALYEVGISVVGAPAALSTLGLMVGYNATTEVTHTTPLTVYGNIVGVDGVGVIASQTGPATIAKIDSASTLPTAPVLIKSFGTIPITGATAQVVNAPVSGILYNLWGGIILEPGAYVAIYTSTVLTVIAHLSWLEIPN